MTYTDPASALFIVGLVLALAAKEALEIRGPEEGSVEHIHEQYRSGDIDEQEMERRLELAIDDEAQQVSDVLEGINGIGPSTSRRIAREFRTMHSLRTASRSDLEDVYGVGPETAEAIVEEFGEPVE